jgi:hypothetical protein
MKSLFSIANSSIATLSFFLLVSCNSTAEEKTESLLVESAQSEEETLLVPILNPEGKTVETRFNTPNGFVRTTESKGSYAEYLRNLPLKPEGSPVMLYNGEEKWNASVHAAVVDQEIGSRDLHQCADAIMRVRAEYLWNNEKYDQIHFNFTNGFRVDYSEWMSGKRVRIKGNSCRWVPSGSPSNTYQDFWKYMEIVFSYAGTLSLSKELQTVEPSDLQIGDVFIQGGSPGHAIVVVDQARNPETGEMVFMLDQSYMPAQELHILKNKNQPNQSPWYTLPESGYLETPEWDFYTSDLKRFTE